ncbi:MAG: hypothetical protein M1833_000973 [Piccolia ochrophora]|nr:MAG: hypothetical protein M1833_000973 [Piccolia ochrophora]
MGFAPSVLWKAPEVNPINSKARSIPAFNPINKYGRVFLFSWWGFLIAFWSWYAFPPLLSKTIKEDLHLTQKEIANSNIAALTATLLVRLFAGPSCDRYGPRNTFAGLLLLGAIPTALAGTVTSAAGLIVIRFFVGILGGTFVPCQVWSTAFFDKNVVGTANAFTGGLGNSGGGITYFVMPAIFDSLVARQGLSEDKAWRVAFIVPFILITATAITMILVCPETPTGKWADRHLAAQQSLEAHHIPGDVVDIPGSLTDRKPSEGGGSSPSVSDDKIKVPPVRSGSDREAQLDEQAMIETAKGEVVVKPTFKEAMRVILSIQSLTMAAAYFNSFGSELAINSILGAYYLKKYPELGQTGSGNWAAMFGLLNVFFRPAGGIISDILYKFTHSLWVKKFWIHTIGVITGVFMIAIGILDSDNKSTMFGLIAGMAFFLEAGNGANYALIPHVHPHANGIISGSTGAAGNLGGVVYAIIFRYNGTAYGKVFWIMGIMNIIMNLAFSWQIQCSGYIPRIAEVTNGNPFWTPYRRENRYEDYLMWHARRWGRGHMDDPLQGLCARDEDGGMPGHNGECACVVDREPDARTGERAPYVACGDTGLATQLTFWGVCHVNCHCVPVEGWGESRGKGAWASEGRSGRGGAGGSGERGGGKGTRQGVGARGGGYPVEGIGGIGQPFGPAR